MTITSTTILKLLTFKELFFKTAVNYLGQQQYDNENSKLSMLSLYQEFTKKIQTCPHELSKNFSLL